MRWERLFDDLDGQLASGQRLDLDAEISDRTRRERARIRLCDRLRACEGTPLDLRVAGAGPVSGVLLRVGVDWLVLDAATGAGEVLVALDAIQTLRGLPARSAEPESAGAVFERLTLVAALRAVSRDRRPVVIVLRDGQRLTGTLDRVGADHADYSPQDPVPPGPVTIRVAAVAAVLSAL